MQLVIESYEDKSLKIIVLYKITTDQKKQMRNRKLQLERKSALMKQLFYSLSCNIKPPCLFHQLHDQKQNDNIPLVKIFVLKQFH